MEAGFGLIGIEQPLFRDLDEARAWLLDRLLTA